MSCLIPVCGAEEGRGDGSGCKLGKQPAVPVMTKRHLNFQPEWGMAAPKRGEALNL